MHGYVELELDAFTHSAGASEMTRLSSLECGDLRNALLEAGASEEKAAAARELRSCWSTGRG